MRPGIGGNLSCTLGDCLISRPKDCLQSRELWFFDIIMCNDYMYKCIGAVCKCTGGVYKLHVSCVLQTKKESKR